MYVICSLKIILTNSQLTLISVRLQPSLRFVFLMINYVDIIPLVGCDFSEERSPFFDRIIKLEPYFKL